MSAFDIFGFLFILGFYVLFYRAMLIYGRHPAPCERTDTEDASQSIPSIIEISPALLEGHYRLVLSDKTELRGTPQLHTPKAGIWHRRDGKPYLPGENDLSLEDIKCAVADYQIRRDREQKASRPLKGF